MQIFFKTLIQHSKNVTIVPETIEKFKSVSTEHFIFIDSFSFLSSSIEKLVESAKEEGEDCFMLLKKHFPDSKQFQMLLRKGIYFYDYASDFKVFNENKLPSRKNFFNRLQDKHISEKDYLHAQEVYKEFNCQSLLDYMQLYVKTDTILLADLFQNFRKTAFKTYGLDPVHYISLPSYGRDAMLKLTGVEIELISNPEVFNLINRGIRGGMIISF